MSRFLSVAVVGVLSLVASSFAAAADPWVEGKHYFLVTPPQATKVPAGKVEVLEVFSYGCPACNQVLGFVKKLKSALPANAQIAYLPAAFNPSENWPMFQRAFITAEALGIAERAHEAVFDAVWKPGGELAITDPNTRKLKRQMPTIEDAAKFYAARTGVKPETFVATSRSFSVEGKIKSAEKQIVASHVDRTPTFIVAGKYRLHFESAGGADQAIDLINFLVAKESAAKR
jgi:protein dithiol oxidoreductase (disulfide-forming)